MAYNNCASDALQKALNDSLTAGCFIDTKFYVFSRRALAAKHGRRVDTPRALYANSHVLKSFPSYFKSLYSDHFSDGFDANESSDFPSDHNPYNDDYEYYSDSDLDEEEELAVTSSNEDEIFFKEEQTSDGTIVDSSLQEDIHLNIFQSCFNTAPSSPHNSDATALTSDISASTSENTIVSDCENNKTGRVLKTFIIKQTACTTFHAILWYIYTGEIEFRAPQNEEKANAERIPRPSAKSVYRFADEHGILELRRKAFEFISDNLSKLNPCQLLEEAFTRFMANYPAMKDLIIPRLCDIFRSSSGQHTQLFNEKVHRYSRGELPHCADLFVVLSTSFCTIPDAFPPDSTPIPYSSVKKNSNRKKIKVARVSTSLPSAPDSSLQTLPLICTRTAITPFNSDPLAKWLNVKDAIMESLISGIFEDSMFHVRHKQSDTPAPLYYNKAVINLCTPFIDTSEEHEGDSDIEDDQERELPPPPSSSSSRPANQLPTAEVYGAVSVWKALLFWLYTGKLFFAPLQSQGSQARKEEIDQWKSANQNLPSPCSPKAIYALAEKFEIQSLRDAAAQDIKSKLKGPNVVQEIFRPNYVSHSKSVLKMALEELDRTLDEDGMLQRVNDCIASMAKGSQPHNAEALVLYFNQCAARARLTR